MHRAMRRLLELGLVAALGLLVAYSAAAAPQARKASHGSTLVHFSHVARLVVKSDSQHAKKGPDGKWHDAFLPADFSVTAGVPVTVTVLNYDDAPHSFTSPTLGVNTIVPGAKGNTPGKATFTLKAAKPGKYVWWCSEPCDPYAMVHPGYMRGVVTVVS